MPYRRMKTSVTGWANDASCCRFICNERGSILSKYFPVSGGREKIGSDLSGGLTMNDCETGKIKTRLVI
jgi:hypothetical protein